MRAPGHAGVYRPHGTVRFAQSARSEYFPSSCEIAIPAMQTAAPTLVSTAVGPGVMDPALVTAIGTFLTAISTFLTNWALIQGTL